jgi:site-specific DNA-methyltransferase (adenine-specific)
VIYNEDFTLATPAPVHSVICDPPYSEYVHKNTTSQSRGGGTRHNDLGFDHLSPELRLAISNAVAAAERWSVVFADLEGTHHWREFVDISGGKYIRTIPWCRWSMPVLAGDRPAQGSEMIQIFYGHGKGRKHWNGLGNLTHFTNTCMRGAEKHKAQKPLDLMLELVEYFSDPGETVLDPCVGSGTTGLACKLLGREFIGYEIDSEWARKATERIDNPKLSDNDAERYERYLKAKELRDADRVRIKANTDKQRAKLDATSVAERPTE